VGTATWLSTNISNNEIITPEWNYNIYRKDRSNVYGGVIIAISQVIPSYGITAFQITLIDNQNE